MADQARINRILVIGPTASGKSEVAAELAQRLGSVVISADARQCYKKLDIGTAKPNAALLAKAPHKYISVLQPDESESASSFRKRADNWEKEHQRSNESPVVYTGGSTLYLQSLLFDLDEMPASNETNLEQLQLQADELGLEVLYNRLKEVDPAYVARIDGMNRHRIYRALDVWMQTGQPFSSFHKRLDFNNPREGSMVFMLEWPREQLHERINKRVDQMMEAGLMNEVRNLLKEYPESLQSLQTVGYREVIAHLKGQISREQMVADIKTNTRRYAKRQLTWFRRWPFIHRIGAQQNTPDIIAESILAGIDKFNGDRNSYEPYI